MIVRIEFDIANASFVSELGSYDLQEVARVVKQIATDIPSVANPQGEHLLVTCQSIIDINGNRVGQWCIKLKELL